MKPANPQGQGCDMTGQDTNRNRTTATEQLRPMSTIRFLERFQPSSAMTEENLG
jgi:hypothetical protein